MQCQYCKKELVSESAYEDAIYSRIIQWLNKYTCITWIRYSPDFKRPGDSDQQYGMVFIPEYRLRKGSSDYEINQIDDGNGGFAYCMTVNETESFTLDLHVLREAGAKARESQPDSSPTLNRSASDVLKQINAMLGVPEFTGDLATFGINLSRADSITVTTNQRENVWEWWAESSFEGTICKQTSYPIGPETLVYCVEDCNGKPLCLEQTCE